MGTGIGSGLMEIASLLIGVALIALIINRAGDVGQLVQASGSTFNDLLRTVTLQGSF